MNLARALELCGIKPGETFSVAAIKDREIRAECFEKPEAAALFLENFAGWGWYFCGNPVRPGTRGKPAADDILEGRVLLIDADPAEGLDGTSCREAILEARTWLTSKDVESVAVDSGRGAQVWVRTDPSLSNEDRRRLVRGLADKFKRPGIKFDGTFNLDRLMRVPGSTNQKTGRVAAFL